MNVTIAPGRLAGDAAAPPSKSYAHRLLICAALSDGASAVRGIAPSQDMLATLDCIAALGRQAVLQGDAVTLSGERRRFDAGTVFPCRESGSTLRFFLPITLALGDGAVFTGTPRLMERGVSVYEALFREKGISLKKTADSIAVRGKLAPGSYEIDGNISSQFVSGLLFALPLLGGESLLRVRPPVESRPYIDITLDALRRFGVEIYEEEEAVFRIPGAQRCRAGEVTVEGDWSNAAVLFAFNALGSRIRVRALNEQSIQGDRACLSLLARLDEDRPRMDIAHCPDLGPVLFAAAAAKHGAVFTGTRRLRIKESDRAAVMAGELARFGVRAEVKENAVVIHPGPLQKPAETLQGHNDHRIVMALTLLSSLTGGTIAGAEAIDKSYPAFFQTLAALGLEVSYEPG